MLGRAARKKVERILEHIAAQEKKLCWSGTTDQADALRLAWWTVWFAAYQESTLPFDAALRKVLGPRYAQYVRQRNLVTLPCPAITAEELLDIDGRDGSQWVRSVLEYLDWRAGLSWRPSGDRYAPERVKYTQASLCLREAFYHPGPDPRPQKKEQSSSPAKSASKRKSA